MADEVKDTVVEETKVVDASKEVTPADDKTLLGKATDETKVEGKKAEELKNETPEAKAARETKEAAELKAKEVPEKYDIKAPEGMTFDAEQLTKLTPIFKELGLTNAQVQKLVDVYGPQVKAQAEAQQKAAMDLWIKETDSWKAESLKLLGADAQKELAYAAKIINKIGTKYKNEDGSEGNKLRDILDESKVGNHPEVTRLFIQLGKLISDDTFVDPSKTSSDSGGSIYDHPDSVATLKR